ncbi:MAG TPA: primosomal protein N' [Bacteroidales bacterium]|nr:primosomal protein N' [Bacteroidales bacterium]
MTTPVVFADVLLPLPLNQTFTYSVPQEMSTFAQVGCRVIVPLGSRKLYTAIIMRLHQEAPTNYQTKPILSLLDEMPVLRDLQLRFWEWLSNYYLCAPGEVMKAALPSGLKLESETTVALNPDFESEHPLKDKETQILQALIPGKDMNILMLSRITGISNPLPLVQELVEKGALTVSEGLRETYKIRTKSFVRLTPTYQSDPEQLKHFMEESHRAKKQVDILMIYLHLSDFFQNATPKLVGKKEMLEASGATVAVLQALINKGVLEVFDLAVDRLEESTDTVVPISTLSAKQQEALDAIQTSFQQKPVCLLHGQTSSGKTEVFIHLIQECIQSGKQVLYLVPEIALTTQLSNRLKRVFGSKLGVYHSKFPDAQRVELWKKMLLEEDYQVILGVRSSIFLPFRDLGLIIIDEEHETSYKQQDPSPRYHARNAALVLASLHGAKTLLGTATPSLETYANCMSGKYGLVELQVRHFDMQMPEIIAVNTKELKRKKIMKSLFSPFLTSKIGDAIGSGGQAILFQNRRGYAPLLECKACAWVPKCERCDVSMTYHKYHQKLTCHYCGFEREVPNQCPSCGSEDLTLLGYGTEKIEEEVRNLFPEALVSRMDTDTTRSRKSYEQIIRDFETKKTNILIGTQMVSKGLDFEQVRVVGILNADQMLNFPDFRAHERSFHLMVQVSGRAGRQGVRGLVVLQTSDPYQPIIQDVIHNNFKGFYKREMALREQFLYPPYTRLIQIRLKHKDALVVRRAARYFAEIVRPVLGHRLLGPDQPSIARINNYHYQQMLLKIEVSISISKIREVLLWAQEVLKKEQDYKSVQVLFDVDPF